MLAATFVSNATFTVPGNQVSGSDRVVFPATLRLVAIQSSGNKEVIVQSAIYQAIPDNTLVSVDRAVLDNTLTEVRTGTGYADDIAQSGTLPHHAHDSDWAGGEKAFGRFTSNIYVDRLNVIAARIPTMTGVLVGTGDADLVDKETTLTGLFEHLTDYTVETPANGMFLGYDADTSKYKLLSIFSSNDHISVLDKVGARLPACLGLLKGIGGTNYIDKVSTLAGIIALLTDVEQTTPTDNQALVWDNATSKFKLKKVTLDLGGGGR